MKIALDAMSGDFAPISTVKGAVEALNEIENLEVILVGKESIIKDECMYRFSKRQSGSSFCFLWKYRGIISK